jgi:hypothetical protein
MAAGTRGSSGGTATTSTVGMWPVVDGKVDDRKGGNK